MTPKHPLQKLSADALGSLLLVLVMLVGIGLAGCHPEAASNQMAAPELSWPGDPEKPVVRWVQLVDNPADLGIRPGFWTRLGRTLFGAEEEGLVRPYGVFRDEHAGLVIVDSGARRIHLMNRKRQQARVIEGNDDLPMQSPIAAVTAWGQHLVITDSGADRLLAWSADQGVRAIFPFQLDRPTGLAFDPARELLYVSETGRHRVVALDRNGKIVLVIGSRGTGPGEFNFPTDLCVDSRGRLWVTDSLNARVQQFAADGSLLQVVGTRGETPGTLNKPKGIAVDSDGRLYVADALQDAVQVFDPEGRFLFHIGFQGSGPAQFWMPSGLHIDSSDRVYVTDTYNRRIQVFQALTKAYEEKELQHARL